MKSKNRVYVLLLAVVFFVAIFFLSSRYWMQETKEMRNENYDSAFELATWSIKITNAGYHEDTKQMTFEMYLLTTENTTPDEPLYTIYNGKKSASKTPLQYHAVEQESDLELPDIYKGLDHVVSKKYLVTVDAVKANYWYVSVNFETTVVTAYTLTQKTDVFGQAVGEATKTQEKEYAKSVQIDYRIAAEKGAKA